MWIEEVGPERLAEFLQRYQQALELFRSGSENTSQTGSSPSGKNQLMAVARLTLLGLAYTKNEGARPREYFAKPGEAEWGC